MDQVPSGLSTPLPLDVTEAPSWLRGAYTRFALISHRRHLAALDAGDHDTLIVATDWLLWQRCMRERRHALHFEHRLGDVPPERTPVKDMVLKAGEWMWDGDRDMTEFHGVSLGQVFVRQCALATQAVERLWYGLDRLCRQFRPRELLLFDLRGDLDLVTDDQKRELIEALADRHGAKFVDRLAPVPGGDPEFPNPRVFHVSSEPGWRTRLRDTYSRAIALAFGLHWRHRGRPAKVLLVVDTHQLKGLLAAAARPRFAAVLEAGAAPKSWHFLKAAWRKGAVLVSAPSGGLDQRDTSRLRAVEADLERHWAARPASDVVEAALRLFIQERLLRGGAFAQTAVLVNRYRRLLDAEGFRRVVVGDADFAQGRVVAELAAARNIAVDESFNGIFLTDWRTPSRCGNGRKPPVVTRLLAWGDYCSRWLAAISSPIEMIVTGNPSLDDVAPLPFHDGPSRRALVLPPYTVEIDPASLSGTVGPYLVELMAVLRAHGFDEIRLKVHPGHANPDYYRALLAEFGEDVAVHGTGSVRSHAAWADIVIGPPTTGAMAECLAIGRPYYAHIALPSCIDVKHIPFVRVFRSARELGEALDEGWKPDCRAILNELCATGDGPSASKRIWASLADALGIDSA